MINSISKTFLSALLAWQITFVFLIGVILAFYICSEEGVFGLLHIELYKIIGVLSLTLGLVPALLTGLSFCIVGKKDKNIPFWLPCILTINYLMMAVFLLYVYRPKGDDFSLPYEVVGLISACLILPTWSSWMIVRRFWHVPSST
jgi:hypothetical protein